MGNDLPFDGAITRFFETEAPDEVRRLLTEAGKGDVTNARFPYAERWDKADYEAALEAAQVQLVRMQAWVKSSGARVLVLFEGRDASGKGGAIERVTQNLNPRGARVVALPKPSEVERGQWYFQRYVEHLPAAGEIVLFDRSWYNRGVVEKVFGFCTDEERARFFRQVNPFEAMLVEDGIRLFKIWINVGRATQLERFLAREKDPLKQWKLSEIDVEGLARWDAYTDAIEETLQLTHTLAAPWTVIRGDDKRRSRINIIRTILHGLDHPHRDLREVGDLDPRIAGGPDIWTRA